MGDLDLKAQLAEAKLHKWDDRTLAQRAAELAQDLLNASLKGISSDERTLLAALSRMVTEPKHAAFVRGLSDRVFHVAEPSVQAENLRALLAEHGGVPPIFSTVGKLRFKAAAMAARSIQSTAIAEVQRVFRSTFEKLSLPTAVEKLNRRVRDYTKASLIPVLNPLVPDVFGPKSAERYRKNLEAILDKQDGVGLVVQAWRLSPELSPYAPERGAKDLSTKLRELVKLSLKGGKARPLLIEVGLSPTLPIVIDAIKLALSGADYHRADVAVELPAYLKNTPAHLRELTEWAGARAAKGANPLKVLLVKGSHLSEEQECSYRYGNANPVSVCKAETEARYKQLMHTAISAKPKAITPVIGTHNAFDLAYALLDWGRSGREGLPVFAFTAGLADHMGRMLALHGARVLLSTAATPEGSDTGFEQYLMQLTEELARPDGFISAGCAMDTGSLGWGRLRQHFLASLSGREEPFTAPAQDEAPSFRATPLSGIGDRDRTTALFKAAVDEQERAQEPLPLFINGQPAESPLRCIARSLTAPGAEDYRFTAADYTTVDKILAVATSATARMPEPLDDRRKQLLQVARLLTKRSTELAALLVRDAGFTLADADAELTAAIDACRYYESGSVIPGLQDGTQPSPLGVIVVAPGRAHPLADAVSGIAAAWVTGNAIVYKPSYHSVLLGYRLTELLAEAGLTPPVLQMLPCIDNQIADKLMLDERVNGLIFRGNAAHSVAFATPHRPLFGAVTGQSSIYLAPTCNRAEAIREITEKLFARRCQAADSPHLVFVHASVYDNQAFMNALKDAVSAIEPLPGHREGSVVGALARDPEEDENALLTAEDKEGTWLVAPHTEEIGSRIWAPGVRTGIRPACLFALAAHNLPVIGLIRTESTEEAIRRQRELAHGMPLFLFSSDEVEIREWKAALVDNCLSVNCLSEPHPGTLPVGSGGTDAPLAGSCDFLPALCRWQETARPQTRGVQRNMPFAPWDELVPKPDPEESTRLSMAADSIAYWWEKQFGIAHTLDKSPAQETVLTYRSVPVCIRVDKAMSDIDLAIAIMAAIKAGSPLEISTHTLRAWLPSLDRLGVRVTVESREEFENRFTALGSAGVRVRDTAAGAETVAAAARHRVSLCRDSVLANGRLELLHCVAARTVTTRTGRVRL